MQLEIDIVTMYLGMRVDVYFFVLLVLVKQSLYRPSGKQRIP
jgi:hypothetical protein